MNYPSSTKVMSAIGAGFWACVDMDSGRYLWKQWNTQLNPVWNEHFEFIVEDASTQHLVVKVFDDEGLQAAELLGCARLQLKDLEPGKVKDVWLKLVKDLDLQRDNKNRGQMNNYTLKLHLQRAQESSSMPGRFNPDVF